MRWSEWVVVGRVDTKKRNTHHPKKLMKNKKKDELIEIIITQRNVIESLCGERYELKSEINILQTIIRTAIPELGGKPD